MALADIQAGRAYVEMFIKDTTKAGLAAFERNFVRWSAGLTIAGGALVGIGTSIVGTLIGTAKAFSDTGSALYDLSKATGISASSLSELGYAAEAEGANLDDIREAFIGLSRLSLAVAKGNRDAMDTLRRLGVTAGEFMSAGPEEKLEIMADALSHIEDPSMRAALALKALGKARTSLIPALAGGSEALREARERGRALVGMTDEQAKSADALGDAWADLKLAIKGVILSTGASLAETLTFWITQIVEVIIEIRQFIANNEKLVRTIFAVGVALIVAGGALIGIGGAIAGFGAFVIAAKAAVVGFSVVMSGVMAVISAILSPVGLLIAGIAILSAGAIWGVSAWMKYTEAGKWTASTLGGAFSDLFSIIKGTLGGIWDAIASGHWELAGNIAMAGLNAAMQRGILLLKELWSGFKTWLAKLIYDAFNGVIQGIAGLQSELVQTINDFRESMGLEPNVTGFESIDKAAQNAQKNTEALKATLDKMHEEAMKRAGKPYEEARKKLDDAIASARKLREEQKQAAKERTRYPFSTASEIAERAGVSVGAQSSFVTRLLARGQDAGPQDKMVSSLESIDGKMDDLIGVAEEGGGLAFS